MTDKSERRHNGLYNIKAPIAIVVAVLLQAVPVVWWAATAEGRIARLEEQKNVPERLASIEAEVRGLRSDLRDLKEWLK